MGYTNFNDSDIRSEFLENYRYANDYWMPFIKDAQVYTLAASGYTWNNNERKQLIKEGREPIEYNIIRRPLQFFSGYLRDNINEIVYGPVEGSDQKTADQFTKLGYYIWDKGTGFPVFLDAADEAFKSGISLCGIQMDYSRDFINGDISFYKRTYNSFYLDPTFESIDLKDCSFAITRDLMTKSYAKQLLPFVDPKEIDDIYMSFRDDKFMQYHPEFTSFNRNRNLLAYDQYYKRTTRKRKFLVDNSNDYYRDITDYSKEELDKLEFGLGRLERMRNDPELEDADIPNLEIQSVDRPYVELYIMLNGQPVYCGEDKTGIVHTYPFVPLICYMEPSIWAPSQRLQGIASCNWSLQRQFNKRHMKITDMMDSTISTGYKYLIGSIADPEELHQSGQNKIIGVDPENAPQGLDSIQELHGGAANPSLIEYQQILDQLSLTLSNVNESSMGIDEKGNTQVSGRLAQVRIAQGLRGNRKIFDNVETAQQVLGGLVLKCIQSKMPPGKVKRILAEEPTEQFYEQEFEQYDAVIKEGVRSKSQKDAYYYELVNLKREGIVNVPESEIVKALSMAGLSDLEEAIAAQDEQIAKAAAIEQEAVQAKIGVLKSTEQSNLAMAEERKSRVQSDLALATERISESEENRALAALNRAKTIVEISSMHEDRILKVLDFVNMLEAQETQDREAIGMKVSAQAREIDESISSHEEQQLAAQQQAQEQQTQQGMMSSVMQGG